MPNYRRMYKEGHCYFLTVVTYMRNPILIENIELLRESFRYSKTKFDYKIEAIVVLPDHIHMIIEPKVATQYPEIIRTIKNYFSKNCPLECYKHIEQSKSREKEGYKPIWQKRFYEHTIRDEEDFENTKVYIYNNPIKHGYVEKIEDWKYSSRRFGNTEHKKMGYKNIK